MNDSLTFSSNWEIDQISYQGDTTVTLAPVASGSFTSSVVFNIPGEFSVGGAPIFNGVWRYPNQTTWRQFGNDFVLKINASQMYVFSAFTPGITMVVRWQIFNDKIEYV